jgi:anti-sigma factor RsiW
MKNSCVSISALLEKYFDHEVTDEERFLVEGHLQDCPGCREALTSMEELSTLMRVPVEEAAREEDFPWVWEKIEREIRSKEKRTGWQSLRSWLDVTPFLKRKVWIPVVATVVVLLFITTQIILKKTPSYPGGSVVEYVESQSDNVMVYQSEDPKVTVIWLLEGPEEERTTT